MGTAGDLSYDPYDAEVDRDPYPVWKRLRDEAPLYRNEQYDFFALSRFEDVERGLLDWETFSSARSDILEIIQANPRPPAGADPVRGPAGARRPPRRACRGCSRPRR